MLIKLLLLGIGLAALHAAPQRRTPADVSEGCMRNSKVPGHNLRYANGVLAGYGYNKTRRGCINECMAKEECMSSEYKESQQICHLNNEVILEEDIGQHLGWEYCTKRNVVSRQFKTTSEAPATTTRYESGEGYGEGSGEESGEESGEGSKEEMYERLLARILSLRVGDNYDDLDGPRPDDSAECIPDSKVPGNNIRLAYAGDAGGYEKETRFKCITKCMNTDTCMSIEFKESDQICHLNTEVISESDIGQAPGWTYCTRRNRDATRQLTTEGLFKTTSEAPATTTRYESEENYSGEGSDEQSEEQSGERSKDFSRQLLNLLEARRNRDRRGAECFDNSKVPGNNVRLSYVGDAGGYNKETRYQCVTKCMNTDTCMSIDYDDSEEICHLNTKVIDEEDIGQHEGWSYCPRRPE